MGYPQSEWPGDEVYLSPRLAPYVKGSILAVCVAERTWAYPPKLREKDEPPPRSPTDANRWVSPPRDCLCRWRQCGSAGGRRARATCPPFLEFSTPFEGTSFASFVGNSSRSKLSSNTSIRRTSGSHPEASPRGLIRQSSKKNPFPTLGPFEKN